MEFPVYLFSKSNPIKSGGLNPRPSGSFLRVCGLWRTEAWAPSRKLRWHYLLSCVGGRELMIARQQCHYLQHQAPVMLPIYTTTLSVFIIHISCGILAWKGVISFMVEGRLRLALRSQGLQQDGVGGGFSGFKASKQPAQTEKKYFPWECNAQSSVLTQNMQLYTNLKSENLILKIL